MVSGWETQRASLGPFRSVRAVAMADGTDMDTDKDVNTDVYTVADAVAVTDTVAVAVAVTDTNVTALTVEPNRIEPCSSDASHRIPGRRTTTRLRRLGSGPLRGEPF